MSSIRAHILSASAGSGKTYRLAYKFVHDVIEHCYSKPHLYRAILAVTFTNKATEEMKSRILSEIDGLINLPDKSSYMEDLMRDLNLQKEEIIARARKVQSRILHDYSRFTVLTIDKFFQRILRAFVKELGLDLNYNIELDTATVLARSADSLIEDIPIDEELQRWMMEYAQENIDDNGAWDLRGDMLTLSKEIFNESSKQTILSSKSKEELQQSIRAAEVRAAKSKAQHKALGEQAMQLMAEAGVTPDMFAGKSRSFALHFQKVADGDISAPKDTFRAKAMDAEGWSKDATAQALALALRPIAEQICRSHDKNNKLWSTLPLIKETYRSYALLQDIYRKVSELCKEEGIMLLSETKYLLSKFVADNDAPFIYEKVGNRYERFMIDEFQDTSIKEWENFVPLLKNAMSQSEETSVLIVGDIKQSIYRWRGGDWRILQSGVSKILGESDTKTEVMADNYRSLRQVVEFNNMVIDKVVEEDNKKLNGLLNEALEQEQISTDCKAELTNLIKSAYNEHAQNVKRESEQQGYVRIEQFEQTPPLIECIESAIERGYSYSDIMILYRMNSDGAKAAKLLLDYKRRNNVFNIMTQESLIIGKAAISNFIIAAMRLSQHADDTISKAIINDYLGRPYDQELSEEEQQKLTYISQLTPKQAFEQIVIYYHLDERRNEIAYLQALHEQVVAFCAAKVADIQLFLKAWDESGSTKSLSVEKSESTIELTTIHKSKGLEKKVVIIPFCSWGLDPRARGNIVWATPEEGKEELSEMGRFPVPYNSTMKSSIYGDDYFREKVYSHIDGINLLYVALTRAKEELYAFVPSKTIGANTGALLWSAVKDQAKQTEDGERSYAEFGTPMVISRKQEGEKQNNILIDNYPTHETPLWLKLPSQRYFEQEDVSITPRNIGILMHEILREATTSEDIIVRIEEAERGNKLSAEQAEELKHMIGREFNRKQVQEWFSEWDEVHNECDIICGQTIGTRRPDRVMISGERAVVVDYKFGAEKLPSHRKQIEQYVKLLRQMGYQRVEGYVWYLSLGEIMEIKE